MASLALGCPGSFPATPMFILPLPGTTLLTASFWRRMNPRAVNKDMFAQANTSQNTLLPEAMFLFVLCRKALGEST